MKIEYARGIPLPKILLKIGLQPYRSNPKEQRYPSPFSNKKSAYLSVDILRNAWFDSATGAGGDTIDFVAWYLKANGENHTVADCLRWLKNMLHAPIKMDLSSFPDYTAEDAPYQLRGILPLSNFLLLRYLEERGIGRNLATRYLREVRIIDSSGGKVFRAAALRNENGGFAIRNSFRKAHIAPATISFIRGSAAKPEGIHIFKDVFDFLSVLAIRQQMIFKADSIIINSYSCLNDVMPYIANYGYSKVQTWLPNDSLGTLATSGLATQFAAEEGLRHTAMNQAYAACNSPNDWLVHSKQSPLTNP